MFCVRFQIVSNSFLANPTTSATFATILVEYLLARMEEMGCEWFDTEMQQKIPQLGQRKLKFQHWSFPRWLRIGVINESSSSRKCRIFAMSPKLVCIEMKWFLWLFSQSGEVQFVPEALQDGVWICVLAGSRKWTDAQGKYSPEETISQFSLNFL